MRFVALLAGALLAAATAAGCGSPEEQSPQPAAATFQECLRQEGIELGQGGARPSGQPFTRPPGQPSARPSGEPFARPSGEPFARPSGEPFAQAPPGTDAAKWQAAMEKCGSLRPSGGVRGSGAPGGGNARFQAYVNCLSEHGVTWTPGQPLPTSDPKVADAEKVCAVLRPSAPAR